MECKIHKNFFLWFFLMDVDSIRKSVTSVFSYDFFFLWNYFSYEQSDECTFSYDIGHVCGCHHIFL